MFLFNIFKTFFSKKKLIYSAFGNEDYFRIVARLKEQGVKYSVKSNIDLSHRRNMVNSRYAQYDFYVKEEDENKAIEAIHRKD